MPIWPKVIMTPLHVNGCRTEDEYRAKQRAAMAKGRARHPQFDWPDPWVCADAVQVLVSGGKWLVACRCGNYPSVSPAWRLALCFECGAIYEGVVMPEEAAEIEVVLVERSVPANRAWVPTERVEDLVIENLVHGVAVPDAVVAALAERAAVADVRTAVA